MQTLKSTGLCLDVRAAPSNVFLDVSRYHHAITNNNVVTVKGMGDSLAGLYNGTVAYLDCGNASSLNITDAITIEAWVKSSSATFQRIISKEDWGTRDGYAINLRDSGYVCFTVYDGVDYYVGQYSTNFSDGKWHHVVGVYNKSKVKVYADGIIGGTIADYTGDISTVTHTLKIGRFGYSTSHFFNGTIYSVRIYNRALPAYEIIDHYYEYAALLGL